ncbi:hypothetical protein D3C72_2373060 [compost metagenome]
MLHLGAKVHEQVGIGSAVGVATHFHLSAGRALEPFGKQGVVPSLVRTQRSEVSEGPILREINLVVVIALDCGARRAGRQ